MSARLFVILQYILPRFLLTSLIHRLARIRTPAVKDFLISRFSRFYDVNIDDVKMNVPADFPTFNDFFIRELADGVRPIDKRSDSIVSPVDGTVSSAGTITRNNIFQAKGLDYSLEDLIAADLQNARNYVDGAFATIYLAPHNYHRVHSPIDGEVVAAHYVPGDLFSVNAATVAHVAKLFSRNERVILHFDTAQGPAALILVGALNVGSISTPWSGEVRPRKHGVVETMDLSGGPSQISKGDLLGWFNMGSTVIILLPKGACTWSEQLAAGQTVRMGETIGSTSG